jgi:uncharacterized membrane protein
MNVHQLTRALGWFSIGLGVAELLAPRKLGKTIGAPRHPGLIRGLGAREVASGVGLLIKHPSPAPWLWSRVAGDIMDLALLGAAAVQSRRAARKRLMYATAAVVGVTALDLFSARKASRSNGALTKKPSRSADTPVTRVITINRPAETLYGFWRNFENLPQVMKNLKSVRVMDNGRSHWEAEAPGGATISWDAEMTEDVPNRRIAWRSLPGSAVDSIGSVQFEPMAQERGTMVRVQLRYHPPAGKLGAMVAKLFGEAPEQQIANDLRRFKQLMETGEITTIEGQSSGRRSSISKRYDKLVKNWASA